MSQHHLFHTCYPPKPPALLMPPEPGLLSLFYTPVIFGPVHVSKPRAPIGAPTNWLQNAVIIPLMRTNCLCYVSPGPSYKTAGHQRGLFASGYSPPNTTTPEFATLQIRMLALSAEHLGDNFSPAEKVEPAQTDESVETKAAIEILARNEVPIEILARNEVPGSSAEPTKGRWTEEEHTTFCKGMTEYPKQWKTIAAMVKTRTVVQIRTHAQTCWTDGMADGSGT